MRSVRHFDCPTGQYPRMRTLYMPSATERGRRVMRSAGLICPACQNFYPDPDLSTRLEWPQRRRSRVVTTGGGR